MRTDKFISALLASVALTSCATGPKENPWAKVQTATQEPAHSIGSASAGCLKGAVSLTPDGPGFHVMRPSRKRYYGHPALVRAIQEIAAEARKRKLGTLLIGDLSQPRGGPMQSMHVSHQTGLNVDIWFQQAEDYTEAQGVMGEGQLMTLDARENLSARSVLFSDRLELNPSFWSDKRTEILKIIAKRPDLDRVLVSPALKKHLCSKFNTPENIPWLSKVRPWFEHQDHFHLTFKCPENDTACFAPKPVTADSACDSTLDWWWTEEARTVEPGPADRATPVLPEACQELLRN